MNTNGEQLNWLQDLLAKATARQNMERKRKPLATFAGSCFAWILIGAVTMTGIAVLVWAVRMTLLGLGVMG